MLELNKILDDPVHIFYCLGRSIIIKIFPYEQNGYGFFETHPPPILMTKINIFLKILNALRMSDIVRGKKC